jgi:hypothetical protein
LAGAVALLLSWELSPPQVSLEFAFLVVAAVVSENYAVAMSGYSFSIAYPLTMATMILCGPTEALIVASLVSANGVAIRRLHWSVNAYNLGQLLLSIAVAAWAYVSLGGRVLMEEGSPQGLGHSDFPAVLLPLLVTAVIGSLGNVALASLGVAVKNKLPIGDVLDSVGWLPLSQVALGVVGFVIAQVMAVDLAAFGLFIFPLLVARQFYQRFTSLQAAYTDTIRSLVAAMEKKDPYTRGHSQRVAAYAVLIGQKVGLDSRSLSDLENAALLHDLGKLALPVAILRKSGTLDQAEWQAVKEHPLVGSRMVGMISPLKRLSSAVEGHHERLDGSGYPAGLAGDDVSQSARILAIADSYDAMTSDRPYRPGLSREAAISELYACSPQKLDGRLVSLFVDCLPCDEESQAEAASVITAAESERFAQ